MIYVDLDGVLADHDKHYHDLTGGNARTEKGKVRRDALAPYPHFFRDIPLMPGAMQLWHFVAPHNPSILTAKSNFAKFSGPDKREWSKEHFGLTGTRVVVVDYPQDKKNYAKPGNILIDDRADNCEEWRKAGGVAIEYHNAGAAIAQLQKILHDDDATKKFSEFIQK
jgi:5'(3')-deoxyribonucleotidase